MIDQNYLTSLKRYVSFKSISTDPAYGSEMENQRLWLKELLEKSGFKVESLENTGGNTLVFGQYAVSPKAETVLVYGHYDVQPATKDDGWESNPFDLTEKNGRLVGRGVVDNKGQNLIHILTVLDLIKQKRLKYNIKFLLEGDEETGATNWEKIFKNYKSKFSSDCILVSDGEIVGDRPAFEASFRGGFNLTLTYTTAKNNLHSGLFGGAVPNAAYELTKFLSKLFNAKNQVAIPGFYDNVDPMSSSILRNNTEISTSGEILKIAGTNQLLTEPGIDFYTQTGLRPTLQVTGLKSGYIGEGYSNIVPATAEARINFRVVKSQKPENILKAFEGFVKKNTPKYVTYSISHRPPHNPVKININTPIAKEARHLLKKVYGSDPVIKYVGGAIPFISSCKEILGVDALSISLGNDDCNMHGVNENFRIDLVEKGLKFSHLFFSS
jgi:acetylornithine deacetylase/succinyl-diaminopimelate desuccinylase-like protein